MTTKIIIYLKKKGSFTQSHFLWQPHGFSKWPAFNCKAGHVTAASKNQQNWDSTVRVHELQNLKDLSKQSQWSWFLLWWNALLIFKKTDGLYLASRSLFQRDLPSTKCKPASNWFQPKQGCKPANHTIFQSTKHANSLSTIEVLSVLFNHCPNCLKTSATATQDHIDK